VGIQDTTWNSILNTFKQLSKDINRNLINSFQKKINDFNIMPKYQEPDVKPIDLVKEALEFQSAQIADLITMVSNQENKIRVLEMKQKVREQIEQEKAEQSKGWFG